MSSSSPVPTTSTWNALQQQWRIGFDKPIVSKVGTPDPSRWSLLFHLGIRHPTLAEVHAGKVYLSGGGLDGTEYSLGYVGPPPFFIANDQSVIQAFSGFGI